MRFTAVLLVLGSMTMAQQPEGSPGGVPHFGTTVVVSGFRGDIYHLHRWTSHLPAFEKMKPVGSIYTTALDVEPQRFDAGFPGVTNKFEWFGINYTARFWVPTAGAYRFQLLADDAADLYIDDRLVIDDDGQHPPTAANGEVTLTRGMHRIRVPYYQGPKWEVALVLRVAPPNEKQWRIFDTENFKPPADAPNW